VGSQENRGHCGSVVDLLWSFADICALRPVYVYLRVAVCTGLYSTVVVFVEVVGLVLRVSVVYEYGYSYKAYSKKR
jgi:hypothetical protein